MGVRTSPATLSPPCPRDSPVSPRLCAKWAAGSSRPISRWYPARGGAPFISPHLKQLRPFLGRGDFAPGSRGQALIDELQPADLSVEKVAFSAFYQSRLEWMLNRAGIETLIFGGIVTNGGVASTVRDAHVRDFHTTVLSDGCAAFSDAAHESTIASLSTISEIATCEEMVAALDTLAKP
tara:strand:+ start:669 stop:1208 length:540 start_codon:yes stop_codon:yes gene_type:complete